MTSKQHAAWIRRGKPWRVARPLQQLRDRLRAYGYTVYDLGNDSHLDHIPPEHHCPYSESNWPAFQGSPMPDVVTAIDIMPPGGGGLPSLQKLGAQLFADKQNGVAPWIVDMNWGPTSNNSAVRDTWRPSHSRSSSSDTGHIHLSSRSDAIDSTAADSYDPVARLRGITNSTVEDPMPFVAKDGKTGQYYVSDLLTSRSVPADHVADVLYLAQQLGYGHGAEGVEWTDGGWTRLGWSEAAFGVLQKPSTPTTVSLSDAQFADLKATLAAAGDGLTGEEVEQAVARALAAAKLTTSFSVA